jgi:hypothetical protein
MDELTLPAFELDCRDWLVAEPGEAGLPEEVGGAPVLAVLSTAVIEADELYSVGAVLSLGLLDDESGESDDGGISQLVDSEGDADSGRLVRYLVPAPDGRLGLLAEFTVDDLAGPALRARVDALMASFRWAS